MILVSKKVFSKDFKRTLLLSFNSSTEFLKILKKRQVSAIEAETTTCLSLNFSLLF